MKTTEGAGIIAGNAATVSVSAKEDVIVSAMDMMGF
jgi:hypothetical protein